MSNSELQALFLRHMRPLQAYLNAKLRDPQLAADLAQESFTRLTEQYPQGNILDIEAYLYKTAKNLMLDHVRQQQRRQTEAVEDDILAQYPSSEPALEQRAIDSQLLQLLQQALADMPPRTQQIFRLNRLDGLTQAQVAAQLGDAPGELGIGQGREQGCEARDHERDPHGGTGHGHGLAEDHEDAGSEGRADADHGQLREPHGAPQAAAPPRRGAVQSRPLAGLH